MTRGRTTGRNSKPVIIASWLSGDWQTIESVAETTSMQPVWASKVRTQLAMAGHHFQIRREGRMGVYRHIPSKCKKGLHSTEAVLAAPSPSPAREASPLPPHSIKGRGRVVAHAAAAEASHLTPPLDAQLTVTLLNRKPDGHLLVGLTNGAATYLCELVGVLPVESIGLTDS